MATVNKTSYLKFSTLFNIDNVIFFDTPDFPEIVPQDDDIVHKIESGEENRIDLLSYDFYKTAELWWVIMLANNKFLITDFKVGEDIIIPSPRYIQSEYLTKSKK